MNDVFSFVVVCMETTQGVGTTNQGCFALWICSTVRQIMAIHIVDPVELSFVCFLYLCASL